MPADRVIALVHDKADGIPTGFRQAQPVPIPRVAGVFFTPRDSILLQLS